MVFLPSLEMEDCLCCDQCPSEDITFIVPKIPESLNSRSLLEHTDSKQRGKMTAGTELLHSHGAQGSK